MQSKISSAFAILLFLLSCATTAQENPVGDWAGTLNMGGGNLRLIFHISESENGYSATIESVDQGGAIIPAEIEVNGNLISFAVEQIDVEYIATITGNEIIGTFTQFGMSMEDFTIIRTE